jgi:hypothetical protein
MKITALFSTGTLAIAFILGGCASASPEPTDTETAPATQKTETTATNAEAITATPQATVAECVATHPKAACNVCCAGVGNFLLIAQCELMCR